MSYTHGAGASVVRPTFNFANPAFTAPTSEIADNMPIGNGELVANVWVNETCKTPDECTTKCAIDGEDTKGYKEKYGSSADGPIYITRRHR